MENIHETEDQSYFQTSNCNETETSNAEQIKSEFKTKENTDLNEADDDLSQKRDGTENLPKHFTQEIYQNLPAMLRKGCDFLEDETEKEVFLLSALGVISGLLPNVKGSYYGSEVESNLYAYLIAPFGEGKSGIEHARMIAMPIHKQLKAKCEAEKKEHGLACIKYNRALKEFEKNGGENVPSKPSIPLNRKLFLPSNNSKTGILQLLHENGGRGILFETEGDTIADTLSQDYGNFSDVLRNAYHHQQLSFFRRSTSEDVEIETPYLSLVLSSTQSQLERLIPSPENGLFSRFLYYVIQPNGMFGDVFSKRKSEYKAFFENLGLEYQALYNQLNERENPAMVELQEYQEKYFIKHFQEYKDELRENVNTSMGGIVNRMGLMCFRISMILTTLRCYESGSLSDRMECEDIDFQNALRIIEALRQHMMDVYWKLQKPHSLKLIEGGKDATKEEQVKQCKLIYMNRISQGLNPNYRDISTRILGTPTKHQTVYRWIHETA